MKIKIISDGTSKGTTVVNSDTGEIVNGVTKVEWGIEINGVSWAKMDFVNVSVEIVGGVDDFVVEIEDKNENI